VPEGALYAITAQSVLRSGVLRLGRDRTTYLIRRSPLGGAPTLRICRGYPSRHDGVTASVARDQVLSARSGDPVPSPMAGSFPHILLPASRGGLILSESADAAAATAVDSRDAGSGALLVPDEDIEKKVLRANPATSIPSSNWGISRRNVWHA